MSAQILTYELRDGVAVLIMDDGRANALGPAMIAELNAALDRAGQEAKAVLIIGRPQRFSAGFDLKIMASAPENVRSLVTSGAELMLRMYTHPLPIVAACTGHAMAAGALLLLAADSRIGAEGDYKIGLPEVAIHMTLPIFALELARDRIARNRLSEATTQARIYTPDEAARTGFLDETVSADVLIETAFARAAALGALPQPAFCNTKRKEREATVRLIRDTLEQDSRSFDGAVS